MRFRKVVAVAAAAVLLISAGLAEENEKKIKRSELPPAVEKTVVEQSTGTTIQGFNQEKENGQTFYEAEMLVNGHSKDVLIDENGVIVEIEEQVELDKLDTAVKSGLRSKAGSGTIVKVESLTKKGKLVAYEAQVRKNGKRSEVQVGPDGASLNHEE